MYKPYSDHPQFSFVVMCDLTVNVRTGDYCCNEKDKALADWVNREIDSAYANGRTDAKREMREAIGL